MFTKPQKPCVSEVFLHDGHVVSLGEQEDWMRESKQYEILKKKVIEAYKRVEANKGSAGIDGVGFEIFEKKPEFDFFGYTFETI